MLNVGLRWRLCGALAAVGALGGAAASTGAYVATSDELRTTLDQTLLERVADVARGPGSDVAPQGADDGDDDPNGPVAEPGIADSTVACPPESLLRTAGIAQLIADDGTITVCVSGGPELAAPARIATGDEALLATVATPTGRYRVATARYHDGGTLLMGRDLSEVQAVLNSLRMRLTLLTALIGMVAGAVGWLVAARLARPIIRLRDAVGRVAVDNDLTVSVPAAGPAEIRHLADGFNSMVTAIAASRDQQRRLVDDAGHELRTPLTSLTTNVELIERLGELPADERPLVLKALRGDVEQLTELMNELVDLAADRSADEPEQPVQLAELADEVVALARRRSRRSIEIQATDTVSIVGRQAMLRRCISNIVGNAVKYSPNGSPIDVEISGGTLRVLDQGAGFDAADMNRVFERFYRSEAARTVPGSGLGLAIVAQIVAHHGGQVWARNRPTGGAEVGFSLPAPASDTLTRRRQ